jgi:hypothetical protein
VGGLKKAKRTPVQELLMRCSLGTLTCRQKSIIQMDLWIKGSEDRKWMKPSQVVNLGISSVETLSGG